MKTTLKEYTECLVMPKPCKELVKGSLEWKNTGELRVHNKHVRTSFWNGAVYREVLEQKWIALHNGELMQTQWRELPREDDDSDWLY